MGAAHGGRMALLTAPSPRVPAAERVRPGGRVAARARSTPGRLTALMLLLAVLGLLAGIAGVVGVMQRSALVDGVRNGSGPLAVQAQQLYRSLSDADATVAAAFLSNGIEPAALRQRYQDDIAAASAALSAVTAGAGTDRDSVARLAAQLPVYTGLIDTARTYNRLGRPLGAAYLREASGLMRTELLPAAQRLYAAETGQLRADRADEALTLVARGSGGDFDKDFDERLKALVGDGSGGLLARIRNSATDGQVVDLIGAAQGDTRVWVASHKKERDLDTGGNYPGAVQLAVGNGNDSTGVAFQNLDDRLAKAIARANGPFTTEARAAADGYALAAPGPVVLSLLMLAGVVAGVLPRIDEFRLPIVPA